MLLRVWFASILGRLVIDRRRLMVNYLGIDQLHDLGEVFIGVIDVGDIDLFAVDEHAEVLADQDDDSVH